MSNKYRTTKQKLKGMSQKWAYCAVAAVLLFGVIAVVLPGRAEAYNQVTNRSIMMSTTAINATNVAYQVNFTTVTDGQSIGSIVVEFCSNSPILGDSCSVGSPAFMNSNYSTLTVNNQTGNVTDLSVDTTNSTANRVVLKRTGGAAAVANGAISFTLGNGTTNGFTNPGADNTTFYARIMTLTTTDGSVPGGNENNATDAGGIALSTATTLRVTAKVQESLLFCVYTQTDCTTGGNAVSLGDPNGVLASNTTTYTSQAYFDVASNAVHGVSIHVKGDTLKSGSFSIDPAGATCLVDPTSSSTEMFGLRIANLGTNETATAPYDCASGSHGFDNNATTGTTSQFGQEIAHTGGATDVSQTTIEFAAKSANTSEAGVYYTDLTLIATAEY